MTPTEWILLALFGAACGLVWLVDESWRKRVLTPAMNVYTGSCGCGAQATVVSMEGSVVINRCPCGASWEIDRRGKCHH